MSTIESRLDDSHHHAAIDSRKFGELIRGFAGQVADAARLADHVRLPGGLPRAVCLLGMGGSAVAGDLLRALADPVAPFPVHVVRGYTVPAWVGSDTLVVASSYSGSTEETLAAFDAARKRTARLLVLSSGGELGALAEREGLPWVRLPAGFPPRAALAFLLLPLVVQLERLGAGVGVVGEREEAVAVLTALGAVVLKERVRFASGKVATASWQDYPILRFSEVPEIDIQLVDAPEQPSLGLGEAAVGPTAAAIGNAVARALGKRIRDLPLTRDRIMATLLAE